MTPYVTPLRYPGGKSKLTNFVKLLFRLNNLLDGHYVEPYAGGAGVAVGLLLEEYASHIHINDFSKPVYAFWHSVLHRPDELCGRIRSTPVTVEEWHRQRQVQKEPDASLLDLGFSTFFLNRTNRSGIIKGGVIGGKGQTGEWKLDARFNRENLVKRVELIARYKSRISLYNLDAAEFIRDVLPGVPDKSLTYFDPPYYVKGERLYEKYYRHADHALIARLVAAMRQPWMVSYDDVAEIRQLYQRFDPLVYQLSYSAAERYKGSEVMFFAPGLVVPGVTEPTKIRGSDVRKLQAGQPLFPVGA